MSIEASSAVSFPSIQDLFTKNQLSLTPEGQRRQSDAGKATKQMNILYQRRILPFGKMEKLISAVATNPDLPLSSFVTFVQHFVYIDAPIIKKNLYSICGSNLIKQLEDLVESDLNLPDVKQIATGIKNSLKKGLEVQDREDKEAFLEAINKSGGQSYCDALRKSYLGELKSIISNSLPKLVKKYFGAKLVQENKGAHAGTLMHLAQSIGRSLLGNTWDATASLLTADTDSEGDDFEDVAASGPVVESVEVGDDDLESLSVESGSAMESSSVESGSAMESVKSSSFQFNKESDDESTASNDEEDGEDFSWKKILEKSWDKAYDMFWQTRLDQKVNPKLSDAKLAKNEAQYEKTFQVYQGLMEYFEDDDLETFREKFLPPVLLPVIKKGWKPKKSSTLKDLAPFLIFIQSCNEKNRNVFLGDTQSIKIDGSKEDPFICITGTILAGLFVDWIKTLNIADVINLKKYMIGIPGCPSLPKTDASIGAVSVWKANKYFLWSIFFPSLLEFLDSKKKPFTGSIQTNGSEVHPIVWNLHKPTKRKTKLCQNIGAVMLNVKNTSLEVLDKYQSYDPRFKQHETNTGLVPFLPSGVINGVWTWSNILGKRKFGAGIGRKLGGLRGLFSESHLTQIIKKHSSLRGKIALEDLFKNCIWIEIDPGRWHELMVTDVVTARLDGDKWMIDHASTHYYLPNSLTGHDTPSFKQQIYQPLDMKLGREEIVQQKLHALDIESSMKRSKQSLMDTYRNQILAYLDAAMVRRAILDLKLPLKRIDLCALVMNRAFDQEKNDYTQEQFYQIKERVCSMEIYNPIVLIGNGTKRGEEFVGPVPGFSPKKLREELSSSFFCIEINEFYSSQRCTCGRFYTKDKKNSYHVFDCDNCADKRRSPTISKYKFNKDISANLNFFQIFICRVFKGHRLVFLKRQE